MGFCSIKATYYLPSGPLQKERCCKAAPDISDKVLCRTAFSQAHSRASRVNPAQNTSFVSENPGLHQKPRHCAI